MRPLLLAVLATLAFAPESMAQERVADMASADRPRFLYTVRRENVALDVSSVPALSRRVSLDVANVPLRAVLDDISSQAGLKLSFSPDVVNLETPVTIRAQRLTVAAALTEALMGLHVDLVLSRSGQLSIVPQPIRVPVGTITGRVIDSATTEGVSGAAVIVLTTRQTGYTGVDGRFTIGNVPAGSHSISIRRLGYRTGAHPVTVDENATATVELRIARAPTVLSEVVTTATGDRQRLEVGNAIGTIKADSIVPTTLIRNVSDLLQARTTGVVVSNTVGTVGAPSRIRIRGLNSIQLNNDPIIIVDGVRVQWQTTRAASQTNTGTTASLLTPLTTGLRGFYPSIAPSRLDDLDPNMIESIDVLRGPSAASLYGTEASNGVIVIKSKRGGMSSFRFNVLGDRGESRLAGEMPLAWISWGSGVPGRQSNGCPLFALNLSQLAGGISGVNLADGTCMVDSVTAFNGQNDPNMTTLGKGESRNLSASLSGGSDRLQEFLSVRASDNVGIGKMSEVEKRRIERTWSSPAPSWMQRPNTEKNFNATSRTTFKVMESLDLSVTANGIYRDVLTGVPVTEAFRLAGNGVLPALGPWDTLQFLPSEIARTRSSSIAKRGLISANGTYLPHRFLAVRGTIGGDFTLRTDDALTRSSDCSMGVDNGLRGECSSGHANRRDETLITSAELSVQLNVPVTSWLGSRTTVGEQYARTRFYSLSASGGSNTSLAFGSDLLSPVPVVVPGAPNTTQLYAVSEARDASATAGWYIEQTAAIRERLFLTGALRQDAASAFGGVVNAAPPVFPKLSASWIASEEPFFPAIPLLENLRLRLAYGQSGNQASQADVLNNYRLSQGIDKAGANVLSVAMTALGNPGLRPERTTEWEGGFDLSAFRNDRLTLEVTAYRKLSRDAIISIGLPASYGVSSSSSGFGSSGSISQRVNLGSVENRGYEVAVTGRPIDGAAMSWESGINYSRNTNRLVKRDPRLANAFSWVPAEFRVGYPVYGRWGYRITSYADADNDGLLHPREVAWTDSTIYFGSPSPESEATLHNTLSFMRGALRLSSTLDRIGGATQVLIFPSGGTNGSQYALVGGRGALDPSAPIGEQARAMQAMRNGGFMDKTDAIRLSELSVTYSLSPRLAGMIRARSAAFTLAGRNLALWTNYVSKDPNVDTSWMDGSFNDITVDNAAALPQTRNWLIRFNLGY